MNKYVLFFTVFFLLSIKMLNAQTNFVKYRSGNPVLSLGAPGAWDDTEAAYAHVRFDGEQYQMWYSGSPVSDTYRIGYATSSDGITWKKYESNPVFSVGASGFDNLDVWQPMVLFNDGHYEMWYVGNTTAGDIGYATSDDGISWTRQNNGNPVLKKGASGAWDQDWIAKPFVTQNDTLYRMWYAGTVQSPFGIWQTGTAMSTDGINWSKHQDNPVLKAGNQGEWDAGGAVLSSFIVDNGLYHMWYFNWSSNADGLKTGYATSTDGFDWTKYEGNPILNQNSGDWDVLNTTVSTVIREGHRWRMWYTGRRSGSVDRLCYAEDFSNAAHVDSIRISFSGAGADSGRISFQAYIANPHSENLTARALIKNDDDSVIASIDIEEDNNSGIWRGQWDVPAGTADYSVGVELNNITAGYVHNSFDWGVLAEFSSVTSVDKAHSILPTEHRLYQNYPNPFNPVTIINFEVAVSGHIELKIYNVLGQEIRTLVNSAKPAGAHQVIWDGRDNGGRVVSGGIYFYNLQAGAVVQTRKMLFIR